MMHQETVLKDILGDMTGAQNTEILMQILMEDQRAALISFLNRDDVRSFWEILEKQRRMDIWRNLGEDVKFNFMISNEYLEYD